MMKRLLVILVLVFATAHVAYADSGFYAGISIGQSEVDDWCDDIVGSCDDEDSGFKIYAGSQVTKNWGFFDGISKSVRVEVGHQYL